VLEDELRCERTVKNASGMTSTRWRAAAHRATGLLANGWRGECAPKQAVLGATASFPGVLNKGLGFDWLPP